MERRPVASSIPMATFNSGVAVLEHGRGGLAAFRRSWLVGPDITSAPSPAVLSSPALEADGTVYVGSHDLYLYAVNPGGTLRWRFRTDGSVPSSPWSAVLQLNQRTVHRAQKCFAEYVELDVPAAPIE